MKAWRVKTVKVPVHVYETVRGMANAWRDRICLPRCTVEPAFEGQATVNLDTGHYARLCEDARLEASRIMELAVPMLPVVCTTCPACGSENVGLEQELGTYLSPVEWALEDGQWHGWASSPDASYDWSSTGQRGCLDCTEVWREILWDIAEDGHSVGSFEWS